MSATAATSPGEGATLRDLADALVRRTDCTAPRLQDAALHVMSLALEGGGDARGDVLLFHVPRLLTDRDLERISTLRIKE